MRKPQEVQTPQKDVTKDIGAKQSSIRTDSPQNWASLAEGRDPGAGEVLWAVTNDQHLGFMLALKNSLSFQPLQPLAPSQRNKIPAFGAKYSFVLL